MTPLIAWAWIAAACLYLLVIYVVTGLVADILARRRAWRTAHRDRRWRDVVVRVADARQREKGTRS